MNIKSRLKAILDKLAPLPDPRKITDVIRARRALRCNKRCPGRMGPLVWHPSDVPPDGSGNEPDIDPLAPDFVGEPCDRCPMAAYRKPLAEFRRAWPGKFFGGLHIVDADDPDPTPEEAAWAAERPDDWHEIPLDDPRWPPDEWPGRRDAEGQLIHWINITHRSRTRDPEPAPLLVAAVAGWPADSRVRRHYDHKFPGHPIPPEMSGAAPGPASPLPRLEAEDRAAPPESQEP